MFEQFYIKLFAAAVTGDRRWNINGGGGGDTNCEQKPQRGPVFYEILVKIGKF